MKTGTKMIVAGLVIAFASIWFGAWCLRLGKMNRPEPDENGYREEHWTVFPIILSTTVMSIGGYCLVAGGVYRISEGKD